MRFRSLDVFRGLTVAAMVIVNNPGDWNAVYWPLLHAEWHGWTPTDLIFPFFLFIVGVAMPLGRERSWPTILRRSAVIFALGLFVSGFPFFRVATWRIPGVLQRIALCYLAGASLLRSTRGVSPLARKWIIAGAAVACLVAYWILLTLVPVPGGTAGDLTGEGNLGAWLDRRLMPGHLWRPGWDPEGLLSTIPAIATTLLGMLAGWRLTSAAAGREGPSTTIRVLVAWGVAGAVLGLAWHTVFPINKSLWTSSYAIFTSGLAAIGLAACYWWVDVNDTALRRRLTEPIVALGRNALLLFVLSGLLARTLIYVKWPDGTMSLGRWVFVQVFEPLGPPKISSLLYAFANLMLLGGICWYLHRRGRYFTA